MFMLKNAQLFSSTKSIQKYTFIYRSPSKIILNYFKNFLKSHLRLFHIPYILMPLPKKVKLKTFLKSPHVNKRAKENFHLTIHKFKLKISANLTVLKILRWNIPKNIHLKIISIG